jgi:hypothetical protein
MLSTSKVKISKSFLCSAFMTRQNAQKSFFFMKSSIQNQQVDCKNQSMLQIDQKEILS